MRNTQLLRNGFAGLFFSLLFFGFAAAQSFEATLTGRVSDEAGAALPNVQITLTNLATGRVTIVQTGEGGNYTAARLAPGSYDLLVEAAGFKRYAQRGIVLQIDQTARVDVSLQVGAVTETVQVTADALLLNTETGAKGQVIDNHEIVDLPLNGRDFNELAYLTPGVVDLPEGVSNSGVTAINGGRADGVNYQVDGMNNRNIRTGAPVTQPSVDAVQEFKVQTSAYAADFGTVGSGLINVALKSGTNRFRGSVYEFARDQAFDARNFFDTDKGELRRHQFGGTIGGPVTLPARLFGPLAYRGHDRTHFFFSFEGLNQRRGDARLAIVPTLAERAGDFSALLQGATKIYLRDPAKTGTCSAASQAACFSGNIIPANRFHPLSVKVLKLVPLPNREGVNNYGGSPATLATSRDFIIKLDQKINERINLAINFVSADDTSSGAYGPSNLPNFGQQGTGGNNLAGIRSTQVFSPSLTNDFRFSFSRTFSNSDWQRRNDPDLIDAVNALSVSKDPKFAGLPRITITGYDQVGHHASYPSIITVNGFQFFDALSIIKGKHNLRTGAEVIRSQYFQYYPNNARGTMTFRGRNTGGTSTPVPMADFLLGLLDSSNRLLDPRKNYLFSTTAAAFVQDDYKIARQLTLNLGLRYDLLLPQTEKHNIFSNFVPELNRVVLAGDPALPRSLVETDKNNFAPRFGFAWRPMDSDKWVVRGGYGIFYTNAAQNAVRILLGNNFPFSNTQSFARNAANPLAFTIADPFPASTGGVVAATIPNGVSYNSPTAYMQNYNLTIERELWKQTAVEVAYVGSLGRHLTRKYDINQQIRLSPQQIIRPFPDYNGAIQYVSFGSRSNYNSLQASLRRNFRRGVGFRANFVWSKAMDDASSLTATGSESAAQDSRNLQLERSLSGFNRPRAFTLDFSYLVPFGRGQSNGFVRGVLGGWQFNGIIRLYDGQPFTPADSTFNFALGEASRPDRIGSGKLDNPTVEKWFKVEDFVQVPTGSFRFGTSGRNILFGPARKQIDLSLMKNFVFAREQKLQFRFEVFNAPNIANFYLPVVNVDVSNAGTITRAQPGREIQLALKYLF